jgi:hypothetical protein
MYIISTLGLRGSFSSRTPMEHQAQPSLKTTAAGCRLQTTFKLDSCDDLEDETRGILMQPTFYRKRKNTHTQTIQDANE